MRFLLGGVGVLLLAIHQPAAAADFSRGDDRLGLAAPPLYLKNWLHSRPLDMVDGGLPVLRGNGAGAAAT